MSSSAKSHYEAGQLQEAILALNAEIKARPTVLDPRGFLAELLCFAGNLDRADLMLDVVMQQDPKVAVTVSLFRQLIRAEQARRQLFAEGRVPEFLSGPTPYLSMQLEATILLREGNLAEAGKRLAEAEERRPRVAGTCDGTAFDDLRDIDDLTAGLFEVLTSTGKYYWVPMERVTLIEFRPAERPRDLLWRRAHMTVVDGPDGEVFLPALYAGSADHADERVKLGRVTDWVGEEGGLVRGVGQRCFLIGDDAVPILQIGTLTFGAGK